MKYWFIALICLAQSAFSQQPLTIDDYSVVLRPLEIEGLMGLQSYSFGQYDGKILFIGGRLDGLHRRQPWASFDSIGHNNQIVVLDPKTHEVWKAGIGSLSIELRDQLKATNSCFTQFGNNLILAGGYGMSEKAQDHITFPYLTVIDLPALIAAVQKNEVLEEQFIRNEHASFAVTGGQLQVLGDIFYLVGGHRFDGRYNPMNGPSFTQTYTSAVRRFRINEAGKPEFLPAFESAELFHRRDMNTVLQQNEKGELYLTTFSGVFREDADLPFLNAVHTDANGMTEQTDFRQFYNHYHCPDVGIYDAATKEMHTLFFGGIAQYYDSLGILVQDNNVPFTKAISRVTRTAAGTMSEYRLPVEMPLLLGAGSEFIPARTTGLTERIFQLQQLRGDSVKLGYLFGGISSSEKNIFWINEGKESVAYNGLFEVFLVKRPSVAVKNENSNSPLKVIVEKDEKNTRYYIDYTMPEGGGTVSISWTSPTGKKYASKPKKVSVGEHTFSKYLPKAPGIYQIEVSVKGRRDEYWKQFVILE